MIKFHLDKHFSKFSEADIFFIIQYLTSDKSKEENISQIDRQIFVGNSIGRIKTENLLLATIHYLQSLGWLDDLTPIEDLLFEVDSGLKVWNYDDGIKIKAMAYSALFKYEIYTRLRIGTHLPPKKELRIRIDNRTFKQNADSLIAKIRVYHIGEDAKTLPLMQANRLLQSWITKFQDMEFWGSDLPAKKNWKYLYGVKDGLINVPIHRNSHSHIFKNNGYQLFTYILDNDFITQGRGRKNDISFFYRKMYAEGFIHATNSKFIKWIWKQEILSSDDNFKLKSLDDARDMKGHRAKNYKTALHHFQLPN